MSNKLLQDFYDVSELSNDNPNIVAELIHFHHSSEERLSRILTDVNEWIDIDRLDKYGKTLDLILSLPASYIKTFIEIKQGHIKSQCVKINRKEIEKKKDSLHLVGSLFEGIE